MAEDNSYIILDNTGKTSSPTKMSVIGLPKTLVLSLNSILDGNLVSSWNIKANSNGTQVWIRFNSEKNSDNLDTSDITYRKVPPTKVQRDRERARQRSEKGQLDAPLPSLDNSSSTIDDGLNTTKPVSAMNQPEASNQSIEISQHSEPNKSSSSIAHRTRSRSYIEYESPKGKQQYNSSHCTSQFKKINYHGKRMNPICKTCCRRYVDTGGDTYICTYCPAPVCVKCVDSGKHMDHRRSLDGPYPLQQLAE